MSSESEDKSHEGYLSTVCVPEVLPQAKEENVRLFIQDRESVFSTQRVRGDGGHCGRRTVRTMTPSLHSTFTEPRLSLVPSLSHFRWSIFHPRNCSVSIFCSLAGSLSLHALYESLVSDVSDTEHFCQEWCSLCIHARVSCIYDYFFFSQSLTKKRTRPWWMSSNSEIWIPSWSKWHKRGELLNINGSCQQRIVTGIRTSL